MAWDSGSTTNKAFVKSETVTMASTAVAYTSEINFLHFDLRKEKKRISIYFEASAVTGTNFDIALYGAHTEGGTKVILKDVVVADITDTTPVIGVIDLNEFPMPYYYLGALSDTNETANTMTIVIVTGRS